MRGTRWIGRGLRALGRGALAVWGARAEIVSDVLLVAGTAALVYGVAQVHVPSAWVAGGALAALAGWRIGT